MHTAIAWLCASFRPRVREPYIDFAAQHNFRMGIWKIQFAGQIREDAKRLFTGPGRKILLDHADNVEREGMAMLNNGMTTTPPTFRPSPPAQPDGR
jgi:hypothetical protein